MWQFCTANACLVPRPLCQQLSPWDLRPAWDTCRCPVCCRHCSLEHTWAGWAAHQSRFKQRNMSVHAEITARPSLMACCIPGGSHHCHHRCVQRGATGRHSNLGKGYFGQCDWHLLLSQRARNQPQTQTFRSNMTGSFWPKAAWVVAFIKGSSARPSCETSNS